MRHNFHRHLNRPGGPGPLPCTHDVACLSSGQVLNPTISGLFTPVSRVAISLAPPGSYTSLWRSHYLGSGCKAEPLVSGGSRHPRASNPLSEGGVSGKFTDPTKSSNPGTAIWKGTTCCTGVSIRQTLT